MERTIHSRLLRKGKSFSFRTDEVELPSGRMAVRDVVDHPGAVAIIPLLEDGRLVLVRQYRYAAGKVLLEIPAGTLDPGEDPLDCAVRELREETGYAASSWEGLLSCYMAPGYSSELIHFYVAEGLAMVGGNPEEDEEISTEILSFDEALRMIEENSIEDAKTIIGVLAYLTRT